MARRTKTSLSDDVILDLESRLSGTLKPIQPSSDIVQRLRERIRFPSPEEISSTPERLAQNVPGIGWSDVWIVDHHHHCTGFLLFFWKTANVIDWYI